jgi:hypothetical protein
VQSKKENLTDNNQLNLVYANIQAQLELEIKTKKAENNFQYNFKK